MVLLKFPPSHLLSINSGLRDQLKLNSLGTVISSKVGSSGTLINLRNFFHILWGEVSLNF